MENIQIYISILALVAALLWKYWTRPKRKLVGHVVEIRTHPVKSAQPLRVDNIEVGKLGLKHDRQFALLNKYGTFTTLRKYPKFVLIKTEILNDQIRLQADGMPDLYLPLNMEIKDGDHIADVTVWKIKTQGVHVSKEADEWFGKFLNLEDCKLYCYPTDGLPRYSKNENGSGSFEMMFPDGCPILIISEESLKDLNEKYSDEELTMDRFRPNIVMGGCEAYAEDTFKEIQIGDCVNMKSLWPCERCVAINIVSEKGMMSKFNLLNFLNRNRSGKLLNLDNKGGMFGCNYGVLEAGHIKIGDPIYSIER